MNHLHLACVVGARPNFMKMAPLLSALKKYPHVRPTLIHTGQHYDAALSDVFFQELDMQRPDVSLEVGSGKHGEQTARILERMEAVLETGPSGGGRYDRIVVVGDVNSTLAAALAAAKLQIPVAHVEAGLRSFDRTMPEETNRILTDAISDALLVSEQAGVDNLRREGRSDDQIFLVGNVMIDTLRKMLPLARERDVLSQLHLQPGAYGFVTLHRPSNVDEPATLSRLIAVLRSCAERLPLVFPVHPRTRSKLAAFGLATDTGGSGGLRLVEPLGYLDCLALTSQAKVIVTDSGGLQEESTALGVPCLTLRENTERPVTVEQGTSRLIGSNPERLEAGLGEVLAGRYPAGRCPELWDGKAAERIAAVLANEQSASR